MGLNRCPEYDDVANGCPIYGTLFEGCCDAGDRLCPNTEYIFKEYKGITVAPAVTGDKKHIKCSDPTIEWEIEERSGGGYVAYEIQKEADGGVFPLPLDETRELAKIVYGN